LAWIIQFDSDVEKDLRKLDKAAQKRILNYLRTRIANSSDPRIYGKPLQGKLTGLWRYRVDDYRIVCQIQHSVFTVLVIKVRHRKEVYS